MTESSPRCRPHLAGSLTLPGRPPVSLQAHREILAAIEAGEARARPRRCAATSPSRRKAWSAAERREAPRAMEAPTHYADSNGVNIAYQVHGEGPLDLVFVPGFVSHVELIWEEPSVARFFRRLASFARARSSSTSAARASPTASGGRRRWRSRWTTCGR